MTNPKLEALVEAVGAVLRLVEHDTVGLRQEPPVVALRTALAAIEFSPEPTSAEEVAGDVFYDLLSIEADRFGRYEDGDEDIATITKSLLAFRAAGVREEREPSGDLSHAVEVLRGNAFSHFVSRGAWRQQGSWWASPSGRALIANLRSCIAAVRILSPTPGGSDDE